MFENLFPLIIGVILVATPSFVIGWATGVGTIKDRNKKVTDALERYTKTAKRLADEQPEDAYWRGYASGVESTLKALYTFLATFEGDKKNGSS